jgi:hypothetical protein
VLAIVVAALSFVLPCLLAFFLVGADRLGDHRWWLLLSPFALDARDYERLRAIYVLSAWAAAITAAHVFWFVRQVRDFGRALVPGGARDSN